MKTYQAATNSTYVVHCTSGKEWNNRIKIDDNLGN